jgi:hypothetical protein
VLAGPLYWLGVMEWGGDGERWDRVCLSDRGRAWLFDATPTPDPVSPRPCEHLPPRGLRAAPECDLGLLWQLEPYLELAQRGPPSEYQLTRASFARGLEAGGSASALRDLLEHAFAASLPQAMALAIDHWSSRGGRFQIRPAVLLTAADESELSAVLEHADIAGFVQERLGPRSAAIEPARAVELADALERSGSLAEVDAALQLMAGRRAYSALVDQHTLETLFVALQVIRSLKIDLGKGLPHADRLIRRLELALGDVQAPRLTRQARSLARDLKRPPRQRQDTARESWP